MPGARPNNSLKRTAATGYDVIMLSAAAAAQLKRQLPLKHLRSQEEVINDWASELAVRLSRSEEEIRRSGLSASDFSPASSVEIREPSGLVHRVTLAFAVIRPSAGKAAVFSEHAGYLEFALEEDTQVVQITEDIYRHGS